MSPVIAPSRSPHLWIVLLVHQVARLGSGHEAMSARKQLEEALKDVPKVIKGFGIQLTNSRHLASVMPSLQRCRTPQTIAGSTHSYKATSSARPIVQRSHLASGTFADQYLVKHLQSTCKVQSRSPKTSTAALALKKPCATKGGGSARRLLLWKKQK